MECYVIHHLTQRDPVGLLHNAVLISREAAWYDAYAMADFNELRGALLCPKNITRCTPHIIIDAAVCHDTPVMMKFNYLSRDGSVGSNTLFAYSAMRLLCDNYDVISPGGEVMNHE